MIVEKRGTEDLVHKEAATGPVILEDGGHHPPKALDKVSFLQSEGVVGYNKKKN